MIRGILINEGTLNVAKIEDKLETFYELLECNMIDIVERKIGGQYYSIVCDEEGLYNEDSLISMLSESSHTPMLVGSLFICRDGGRGDLKSLTDDDVKCIKSKFKFGAIWGEY